MTATFRVRVLAVLLLILVLWPVGAARGEGTWPPKLSGSKEGAVHLESALFLRVPENVEQARRQEGAASFVVAKTAPAVELAYHGDLGPDAASRRLWSSWGDICVAGDGMVYCGIGDHADDAGGDARCFLYAWDPQRSLLVQVADLNRAAPRKEGHPAWAKVHARIDEGPDGKIYVSGTLNDGNRASQERYRFDEQFPGGQIYQYDPATGDTVVFANLPPRRCTATSILDRRRNIWWCNLEAGEGNALWGLDLATKETVVQTADGAVAFNRNFALANDGTVYFNGAEGRIGRLDPKSGRIRRTKSSFSDSPGMRSSTRQSQTGWIYGTTHKTNQLFRYHPANDRLELLGPTWLMGDYTTVTVLSPDERYVYYLPGAHGKGFQTGTPVIQYEIATGRRKVLAFLAAAFDEHHDYVPAGTYGVKISADGGTLYVNFNGHAGDRTRPEQMRANGFGLCAFAAIHIPLSERR